MGLGLCDLTYLRLYWALCFSSFLHIIFNCNRDSARFVDMLALNSWRHFKCFSGFCGLLNFGLLLLTQISDELRDFVYICIYYTYEINFLLYNTKVIKLFFFYNYFGWIFEVRYINIFLIMLTNACRFSFSLHEMLVY